jgi:hypothetical protein
MMSGTMTSIFKIQMIIRTHIIFLTQGNSQSKCNSNQFYNLPSYPLTNMMTRIAFWMVVLILTKGILLLSTCLWPVCAYIFAQALYLIHLIGRRIETYIARALKYVWNCSHSKTSSRCFCFIALKDSNNIVLALTLQDTKLCIAFKI